MTCEEIIKDIQENLQRLTPREISDHSIHLSIFFGNKGDQLAQAELDYAKKFMEIRIACDTDKQAEMKSKTTVEYYKKKILECSVKSLKELIQALKKRLSVLSDESCNRY